MEEGKQSEHVNWKDSLGKTSVSEDELKERREKREEENQLMGGQCLFCSPVESNFKPRAGLNLFWAVSAEKLVAESCG